jgi:hypothetical protein
MGKQPRLLLAQPSQVVADADEAQRALALIRERYGDFGPTPACERLYECHGIRLARETLRQWMYDA